MKPHTVLVAFVVNGSGMEDAQQRLMARLPNPEADGHEVIDCWWIAEYERYDGSDNDSAVFVPTSAMGQGFTYPTRRTSDDYQD